MSATLKALYNSNNNSITFSGLSSLANGSRVVSSVVLNTSALDLDWLVSGKFTTAGSGVSATGTIEIRVVAASDGGTVYSDQSTDDQNVPPLAVLNANANSTIYVLPVQSVAAYFGGSMPSRVEFIVTNKTGAALAATSAMWFEEFQVQSV
jgi:hypothetical protein